MLHSSQPITIHLKYLSGSKKISLYPKSRAGLRERYLGWKVTTAILHPWQIWCANTLNSQNPSPKPKGQTLPCYCEVSRFECGSGSQKSGGVRKVQDLGLVGSSS